MLRIFRPIKRNELIIYNEMGHRLKPIVPLRRSQRPPAKRAGSFPLIIALALGASLLAVSPHPAARAQSNPQFALPIACEVHVDCWIVNYFDSDPGPGARDYANGFRTYNNHNGTDIAVRDLAAMNAGVPVLAAADGKVRGRRDGMDDVNVRTIGREAIKGRECGNGVVIDHAPGWATQYCHMRKGSVRVSKGQAVKTGDVIGFVGNSGLAEFPHVHFNVFRDKKRIDPFAAGGGTTQLWASAALGQMRYEPVSVYAAGFREAVPDGARVKQGNIQNQDISATSPAILFWTGIFGIRTGDTVKQILLGPDGKVLAEREVVQKKNQIRRFLWIGKKRGTGKWPAGKYTGRTTVTPADGNPQETQIKEIRINITPAVGK